MATGIVNLPVTKQLCLILSVGNLLFNADAADDDKDVNDDDDFTFVLFSSVKFNVSL